MLETIRAYALERLVESGEIDALRADMRNIYGGIILNQAGLQIYSSNSLHWLNWFEQELDNIRATLSWGLSSPQGIQLGTGLVSMLFWFGIGAGTSWKDSNGRINIWQCRTFKIRLTARIGTCIKRHDGAMAGQAGYRTIKTRRGPPHRANVGR